MASPRKPTDGKGWRYFSGKSFGCRLSLSVILTRFTFRRRQVQRLSLNYCTMMEEGLMGIEDRVDPKSFRLNRSL